MAKTDRSRLTIEMLEPDIDSLINKTKYFDAVSEDLMKLVHRVFFVHAILEGQLRMRVMYKFFEEQMKGSRDEWYGLTETMNGVIEKLTYTDMLTIVREFNDGAPCGTLEKINRIRNGFWHPASRGWKAQYSSNTSRVEVLQLLMVGLKVMEEYMEKVRKKVGM